MSAQHAMYAARYQRIVDSVKAIQGDIQSLGSRTSQARWQRVRGDLHDLESEIKQLHAAWLRLLEVIEDLDYLQQIRELGTRDLQQLSQVLSHLRVRHGAVESGAESVRQYVPAPGSVVVTPENGQESRRQTVLVDVPQ